jgi:glycyl-tRNA synthetase
VALHEEMRLLGVIVAVLIIMNVCKAFRSRVDVRRGFKSPGLMRVCMSTKSAEPVKEAIAAKGNEVRELKAAKAEKAIILAAVDELVQLKKELAEIEGVPYEDGSIKSKKKKEKEAKKAPKKGGGDGEVAMEEIVNLCKRKGFIFQSSEIYSPYSGFFDYGPLGTELKNNIKQAWWREFVHRREDIVGIDSSIIASPAVWQASGHVEGFSDPMVDCKESKLRFRADQVFWGKLELENGGEAVYVSILEDDEMQATAEAAAKKKAKSGGVEGPFKPFAALKDLTEASEDEYAKIPSPATGEAGHLTAPRDFNLMFQTSVGAMADGSSVAYLRPETAQGIFTNFANVQRSARMKIPFGIAQIGKAFRNEITPRNFIFRSREFEQMEIEYFIQPEEEVWEPVYKEWIDRFWAWLLAIGIDEKLLERDVKSGSGLAHYARACTDITFKFPFGTQELMGVAARGSYDLDKHSEASGKALDYFDDSGEEKRRFIPHVVEPSCGVDRLFLALLTSAYQEEEVNGEKRVLLKLHPSVAPVKVAVFPLVNNKPELTEKARDLFAKIQSRYACEYDTSGAIGRRYRRADEGGVPFCVTVDFDSLEDDSVTVRKRDSMEQVRMSIGDLPAFLAKEIEGLEF